MRNGILFILLFFAPLARAQDQAYVGEHNDRISIGNRYVERVISLPPGKGGSSKIVNKLSGKTYIIQDNIFELQMVFAGLGPAPGKEQNGENDVVLSAKDFRFTGYEVRDRPGGGKELTLKFRYDWGLSGLLLKANFEIDSARYSLRKWIEVSDSLDSIQFVDRMYVESMTFSHPRFSGGKLGQPLFNDDIFWGVEYPTAETEIHGNAVRIGYVCGCEIGSEPYRSHSSILGCARSSSNRVDAFMDYVDGIKVSGTRPYLLYNSWYDLRNPAIAEDSLGIMNEKTVLSTIDAFKTNLYDRHGIRLDAFVLDDGWDSYDQVWGIDSLRFPKGFSAVANALKSTNSPLGLWASPFGGYSNRDLRVRWANKNGYETTGNFLCLAGTKYRAFYKNAMEGYERNFGVGYFKWDGMLLSCSEPNHGHPQGTYSRGAQVDAYIDVMNSVRKQDPQVFLNITTGAWLSPWWLRYADCMWMQGEDYAYQENAPSLNDRQKSITYKDVVLFDDLRKMGLLFPMSSMMTHGIIKGRYNLLGGANESLGSFCDEAMMYFGRGVMMWELYISPDVLSAGEWNAIASSVKWAKSNRGVLKKTRMVLGDPRKGEAYGYLHMTREKGILLVRNPGPAERTVRVNLTPDLGDFDASTDYYVKVIYPYNRILSDPVRLGGVLSLGLGGYEVLTAELVPADNIDRSLPIGQRYSIENGDLLVWGTRGERSAIRSLDDNRLGDVRFGEPVTNDSNRLDEVRFGKLATKVRFSANSHTSGDGTESSTRLDVSVPEDFAKAEIAVLLELSQGSQHKKAPVFKMVVNGVSRDAAIEGGDSTWFWVTSGLDRGRNGIECSIRFAEKEKGKVSFWLMGDRQLSGQKIRIGAVSEEPLLPAKPYPASIEKVFMPLSHAEIHTN
jgi:hypothetical protein